MREAKRYLVAATFVYVLGVLAFLAIK